MSETLELAQQREQLPVAEAHGAERKRIVIIGAGFAGMAAARALRKCDVEIILIDRRNHHIFQPLLYQVATAILAPSEINDFFEFYCARTTCLSAVASAEWSPTRIKSGRSSPFGKFWQALLGLATDGRGFPYIRRDDFEWKRTGAKVLGLIRERRIGWRL